MNPTKKDNLAAIILSVLLAYLTYLTVINQLPYILSDYNGHTYVYLPLFNPETWIQGWKTVPYCIWHLSVLGLNHILHVPIEAAAAYVSCFFALFSFFVIYWMILKYTAAFGKETSSTKAAIVSFGFCLIQALFFYWLDGGDRFLGAYSMNPVHNPTQMTVRPFSLLCYCLVYDLWNKQKDDTYTGVFFNMKQGLKKPYIYLAVLLLLSTMAKPTFAEMFIPAVGIVMLVEWIGRILRKNGSASKYFKYCLHMLCCAIPSLAYILLQFLAYFFWGGSYGADGSFMITKWLEVWNMYSENVILSIGLGMAFPLFMIFINGQFFLKDSLGRLALTGYLVGFLEAALLGEGGIKLSHSDFLWPMMSGMLLVWTASTLRLFVLEKTQADTKIKHILIDTGWFLFFVHVLFGILYTVSLFTTG
ncbi:MAG: hypothetical protein E7293_08540 [Lachnospiraceae bacterium]|nr:hypothetical protein [Lachnospiraceae bacterium]